MMFRDYFWTKLWVAVWFTAGLVGEINKRVHVGEVFRWVLHHH